MASASGTPVEKSSAMNALLAHNWWAILLRGVAVIVFGLIALFLPVVTIASLVILFAAYMIVDGVLAIVSAVKAARSHERWGGFLLEGVVDLVAAAVALLMPAITLLVFVGLMAAWAVISGALMLWAAFKVRKDHGRVWPVIAGLASILWGVLIAAFPVTGLVVLTWWIGAYAFVFGVSLLVLAATLRRRRHAPAPPVAARTA